MPILMLRHTKWLLQKIMCLSLMLMSCATVMAAPLTPLADTPIGKLAARLTPGEFVPLEAQLPPGFARYYDFLRSTTFDPDTWHDSAHWDSQRQIGLLYGDRKKAIFIAYEAQTHRWKLLSLANGPAPFAHVYGKVALDPVRGHYYKMSAFRAPRVLHRYIIDEDRWEVATRDFPGPQGGWEHTDPLEWHDALGHLIYIRNGVAYGWVNGHWQKHGALAVDGYHSSVQYNPVRKEMLFIGGNKSRNKVSILDAQGRVQDLPDAPFNFNIHRNSLTYDPETGHYLVLHHRDGRSLWELNPATREWRQARTWQADNWPFSSYGGIVPMPIPDLGAILWLHQDGPKLYKHASAFAAGWTPPTRPAQVAPRASVTPQAADSPPPILEEQDSSTPTALDSARPAAALTPPTQRTAARAASVPPATPQRSKLYGIAADMKPGEFRAVRTQLPSGVPTMARFNNTYWHDPKEDGTFGVGWTDRHIFDPVTGRLFNILMRDVSVRSVTWLEPDLTWKGVVAPPGLDYPGAERRPYNRLMDGGDGYLYFSPSKPGRESIGRLVRAPYTNPEQWEEFGVPGHLPRAHAVGDHSSVWHPDIEKFVLYTTGPASQSPEAGEGFAGHIMGHVHVWGPGDSAWSLPENHPNYAGPRGRTQSSGYGGTTLYNPVRREVLIFGGMTQYGGNDPLGNQATATLDAQGRFQRHGASGLDYTAGSSRLTYHPRTGEYILLKNNAKRMYIGDPPRGQPWRILYDWSEWSNARRPFDRYENWHRVTPLPGTDVLIWSDLRRGIILQRLPED